MVFGLKKRESRENVEGGSWFSRKGRSSASLTTDSAAQSIGGGASLTEPSSLKEPSTLKSDSGSPSGTKPEVAAKPEETPPPSMKLASKDTLASSLDAEALGEAFQSELNEKKLEGLTAVESAQEAYNGVNNSIKTGERALQDEKASIAKNRRREEEALEFLTEHANSLEGLKMSLHAQVTASRDKVVRDNTTSKRLETELAAAEEAVRTARAKADEARLRRAENVATNTARVAEADDRVVIVKAQMAAATERHKTTEACLALMKAHIGEVRGKVAACEREKDFALEAMEALSKDNTAAAEAKQKASDVSSSCAAALKAHVEDSERRVLGHEAELRRCQTRLQAAEKLRDLKSRPALHDGDSLSLEKARSNAKFAADQAAVALESEKQALKATNDADEARTKELSAAAEKAATSLSQRELAMQAVASRYTERKKTAFNARALHTAAIAELDTISQEVELTEKRVADLQEAQAACALKVEEAESQAADALRKLTAEEMPLKHAEQAEAIVVQSREQDRANIRRALEVARLGSKEAEADALQLSTTDMDVSAVSVDHGMVISEMEVRLQEKELVVQQAQVAREAAEKALADAEAELKAAEDETMPSSFGASDTLDDPDSSERLNGLRSQEVQMRKTLAIATVDSHKSTLHAAQVEEELGTAALVSVKAELEQAQAAAAAQSNAVKQMMTADLVQVEIADTAQCQQQHSSSVAQLQDDEIKASEKWDAQRETLKADLHRAQMALNLAKEDLKHNDGVREMFK